MTPGTAPVDGTGLEERVASELDRARESVADGSAATGLERIDRIDRLVQERAVVRGDGRHRRVAGEGEETDAQPVGNPVEERARRFLRGLEARRGDVAREHRPRRVDHEHDGGVLNRLDPVHVRPRERDAEKPQHREEEPADGEVPAARKTRRDGAQDLEVREPDRVTRAAPAHEHEAEHEHRQHREGEKRERAVEAQAIRSIVAPWWRSLAPRPGI